LLAEDSAIADLEKQFPALLDRLVPAGASSTYSMTATPLTDIHLHSNRQSELSPPGSMATVNAFIVIALLVLLVACMNFMNLSTVKAVQRAREVGVRKVLGGSVWSIIRLLTNDFSKLVLLSNLIAWPVAYITMNRWLENFAYRIDLTPLIFIGSGLIALCIAWVMVGGTAAKAASAKPVLALRYE
jgi:ABC-type antimicrobial peptide transport system permease subunit